MAEERIESRVAYDGRFLTVRVDDVRLPSGREAVREYVEHPGSAVIVPITTDGHVLLVRQYRYVVGEHVLELPAGLIDPGESPEETARRELIEEVGHEAGTMRPLAEVYPSPGCLQERSHLFLAEQCTPVEHDADIDEPLDIVRVPLAEIPELISPGADRVRNGQAMLGLLWLVRLGLC